MCKFLNICKKLTSDNKRIDRVYARQMFGPATTSDACLRIARANNVLRIGTPAFKKVGLKLLVFKGFHTASLGAAKNA